MTGQLQESTEFFNRIGQKRPVVASKADAQRASSAGGEAVRWSEGLGSSVQAANSSLQPIGTDIGLSLDPNCLTRVVLLDCFNGTSDDFIFMRLNFVVEVRDVYACLPQPCELVF